MSETLWWPAEYLDEIMPAGRAAPSDWIIPHGDGWAVAPADEVLEGNQHLQMLRDGEVVEFVSCETHCTATLVLKADGNWWIEPAMPPEATLCCVMNGWQGETLAENYEEMMMLFLANDPEPDDDYPVSCFTRPPALWFRFEAASKSFVEDGTVH